MGQKTDHPVHWTAFVGAHPFQTLNPLAAFLETGPVPPAEISLFCDPGEVDLCDRIIAHLQSFFKAGQSPVIQKIEYDKNSPEKIAQTLQAFLTDHQKNKGKVLLDLSAAPFPYIPALLAQMTFESPQVLFIYLQIRQNGFQYQPLVLLPRSGYRLFVLDKGAPREMEKKAPASHPVSTEKRSKEWRLSPDELILLPNALVDLGYDRNVVLQLPLLRHLPVCRFHFEEYGVSITHFIQESAYRNHLKGILNSFSTKAREQIPDYNQLVSSFYSAGIFKPAGLDEFSKLIAKIATHPLDQGGDVYHLALDTNLLRDRFFSVYLGRLSLPPNVDFVLCETVRSELLNRLKKIDRTFLEELAALGRDMVGDLFFNQNQLDDRLRYIGLLEFNRMKGATGCREQDSKAAGNSAMNDRYILEAYSSFVRVGCKVLFLSRDQETIRMMRGEEGVIPVLLEHEERPGEKFKIAWDVFRIWIYLLAVVFGRLEWVVGGTPIAVIDGVWAGKHVEEWEEDRARVKLLTPKSEQDREDFDALLWTLNNDAHRLRMIKETGCL